ncbi:ubiquitin carboxyl-terminal hydrolase 9-like [Apium graveolens]|uniref:ubiquitin carboxyl-terminal hydrolase 9-like n=1 Tax=Apium graveolens TaxID=4045 RepID=UPI003D79F737
MTIPDSGDMLMDNGSLIVSPSSSPQLQKEIVRDLTKNSVSKPGNLFFLISNRWFTGWKKYTGFGAYPYDEVLPEPHLLISDTADRPGPIDNSNIVATGSNSEGEDLQLLDNLEEERDYVVVSQDVWKKLFEWYKGGPVLPRKMISVGVRQELVVEVYPLCLKLIDARDESESTIRLSKKASLHELYERACALKKTHTGKVRIWDYFNNRKQTILEDSTKTLEESDLQMNQSILLEVQVNGILPTGFGMDSTGNELALIPIEPLRSSLTIAGGPTLSNGNSMGYSSSLHQGSSLSSALKDMEDTSDILRPVLKGSSGGLAGLQNLGNTCFMNSSLQCLVHTPPLVDYFLQDYTDEINKQNPLGMHGELAIAFGELLRKIWSSGRTSIAPREFKGKLGRFAPQFSGYNQHDSQELLAFLLDGLHEDLNRVKQKPYIELKDCDGRPDEEVADEFWRYHKARNDSIIVDVCQGQYKSTLVCPDCKKISIAFDPFMYLSLPLPSTATRTMTVTVFYGDGSGLPMPYSVTVLKNGACKDLKLAVASACCLKDDEGLLLAEVYEHTIYRYLDTPLEPLSSIKDNEHIVAYRHPKTSSDSTKLEICHRYLDKCSPDNLKGGEWKLFLAPLVSYVKDIESGDDIDLAVNRLLSPLKRKAFASSAKVFSQEKNGSTSEVSEQSTGNSSAHSGDEDQSTNEVDMEDISSRELSFRLCLSDDRGLSCRPIAKDSPIKPAKLVKVMLDWTEKELDLYDASYLKDLPEVHKTGPAVKKTRPEAISLFSCLDAFLKEEPLGPDDMWYCPRCKKHRQATKKLDLWRLPEILVFHLKRFSYSRYLKNKLDTFVNFPVHDLDLSKYMKTKDATGESYVYELYAISNHYGGLGGGHYSAYSKLIHDDRWYHFDDSHVSPVSEADIRTSAAYVLFYRRVKVESSGVGEPSRSINIS